MAEHDPVARLMAAVDALQRASLMTGLYTGKKYVAELADARTALETAIRAELARGVAIEAAARLVAEDFKDRTYSLDRASVADVIVALTVAAEPLRRLVAALAPPPDGGD